MKKLIYFLIVILLAVGAFIFFKEKANAPQDIAVTDTPTASTTPSATPTPDGKPNITVTSPKSGDTVSNPITVTGTARVFENQFSYVLKDSTGKKLAEGNTMSDAKDSGLFGNYTIKIEVPAGATKDLTIEVFENSAKDGSVVNLVTVPVKLAATTTSTTKVFFGNAANQCDKVVAVNRTILKTVEPAFVSLSELLAGPSAADTKAGYTSALPEGVRINSLKVAGGVATVDFSGISQGVAGACRVQAVTAQVTKTLTQFTSIKSVVITQDGHADPLQP